MQVFKTICRLDYPVSFKLVDNLGKYAESMHLRADAAPFVRENTRINLLEHTISGQVSVGDAKAVLNLGLRSFDFVVEFTQGIKLGAVHKHPVVALADETFQQLAAAGMTKIERLGLRNWVLVEHPKFRFADLRALLVKQLSVVEDAVKSGFTSIDDVGTVFEGSADDSTHLRLMSGPYQESERHKYFTFPVPIKEGLIADVDVWQTKLELPSVSIASSTKAFEKTISRVMDRLSSNLLGGLQ